MKIRVFALFEEGDDVGIVDIDGVSYEFTRDTVQQDIDLGDDKVLTDNQNSVTVHTPAD
jgi:hypothetical protein